MTDAEIKKLLERIKKDTTHCKEADDCFTCVLKKAYQELAEQYLKIAELEGMPEEREVIPETLYLTDAWKMFKRSPQKSFNKGYNEARRACILAFIKALPSENELEEIIADNIRWTDKYCRTADISLIKVSKAIHQRLEKGLKPNRENGKPNKQS